MKYYASKQHCQLADAITAMAGRLSTSAHRAGLAYNSASGSLMGKTHEQWSARSARQFKAVQRLTNALRDVEVAPMDAERVGAI